MEDGSGLDGSFWWEEKIIRRRREERRVTCERRQHLRKNSKSKY